LSRQIEPIRADDEYERKLLHDEKISKSGTYLKVVNPSLKTNDCLDHQPFEFTSLENTPIPPIAFIRLIYIFQFGNHIIGKKPPTTNVEPGNILIKAPIRIAAFHPIVPASDI
jgi:hypothetical protein